jgi:hypothetical protein
MLWLRFLEKPQAFQKLQKLPPILHPGYAIAFEGGSTAVCFFCVMFFFRS